MCSIFGWQRSSNHPIKEDNFYHLLRHRGPDAEAVHRCDDWVLGHQRLSIIDHSEKANMPMIRGDDILVYNGEIFNYLELAEKYRLKARMTTSSDTEVFLLLLKKLGIAILNELNGMFAFAWYNYQRKELYLGRDRFGIKPVYWTWKGNQFIFASEIKPLLAEQDASDIDFQSVEQFFKYTASDFDDSTFYKGIKQVQAGYYLLVKGNELSTSKWYHKNDAGFVQEKKPDQKWIDEFEEILTDSIRLRCRSDVPLAISLSSGIDSTLIYTIMREKLKIPVQPFTFSHPGAPTDEKLYVNHLTSIYKDIPVIIANDSLDYVRLLEMSMRSLESPIWNPSSSAYYRFYQAVHQHGYKVIIEGHGSDEQLGGYPHMVESLLNQAFFSGQFGLVVKLLPVLYSTLNPDLDQVGNIPRFLLGQVKRIILLMRQQKKLKLFDQIMDDAFFHSILPMVLRAFDRMSMAHSIESRIPFLDYRLVEFIKVLPTRLKINELGTKAILRLLLKRYHKRFLYRNKRKMGFAANLPEMFADAAFRDFLRRENDGFGLSQYKEYKCHSLEILNKTNLSWRDSNAVWKTAAVGYYQNNFTS